jgi:hypothetical protein
MPQAVKQALAARHPPAQRMASGGYFIKKCLAETECGIGIIIRNWLVLFVEKGQLRLLDFLLETCNCVRSRSEGHWRRVEN